MNTMLGREAPKPDRRGHRYSGPFVKEIRKRLDSYLAITVRNVRDAIPKAIGFYLVRAAQDKLQFELLNQLNQKDKISELLGEPPHIMEERKSLSSQLAVLTRASAVLTRDPTLSAVALEAEEDEEPRAAPRAAPSQATQGRQVAAATTTAAPPSTVERKAVQAKPDPPRSTAPAATAATPAASGLATSALSSGLAAAAANPSVLSAAASAAVANPGAVAAAASAVANSPAAMSAAASALPAMAKMAAAGARPSGASGLFSNAMAKTSGLFDETKPISKSGTQDPQKFRGLIVAPAAISGPQDVCIAPAFCCHVHGNYMLLLCDGAWGVAEDLVHLCGAKMTLSQRQRLDHALKSAELPATPAKLVVNGILSGNPDSIIQHHILQLVKITMTRDDLLEFWDFSATMTQVTDSLRARQWFGLRARNWKSLRACYWSTATVCGPDWVLDRRLQPEGQEGVAMCCTVPILLASTMPGLWVQLADNPDFYQDFAIRGGTFLESTLCHGNHLEQGKGLWLVDRTEQKKKDGMWPRGRLVAVSGYLKDRE
eukprot:s91_g30.t1